MQTNIFFHMAILMAVAGCSASGMNKTTPPPAPNQTSWTDKMTAPFKSLAPKKNPQQAAEQAALAQDPISVGFNSGPATPALYVSMAQMSDQGGNVPHARAMYQKALTIDPKNLDALLGLARLEDREGNLQNALQVYQQAAKEHPQDARALNDLALCHARSGQMQDSLQLLDQAVRLKPDKQLYRNNIAKVLIELNQCDAALAHMSAVYEPAVANFNMAVLLQERGRTNEAAGFAESALAAKPQMAEASALLASLTGKAPATTAVVVASQQAPSSPIAISAPINIPSNNNHYVAAMPEPVTETKSVSYNYPSTGAPPMIPKPQDLPSQTASRPVGYEPTIFPPIR